MQRRYYAMHLSILMVFFVKINANQDWCGDGLLHLSTSGVLNLSTPYYPNKYPNSANCIWITEGPAQGTFTISFPDFDLETNYDFLEIGSGNTSTAETKVLKLSGQATPTTLSVHDDAIWIRFTSDRGVAHGGFFIQIAWTVHQVYCMVDDFECANGYGCLRKQLECDHFPQCLDKSDEAGCNFCGSQEFNISHKTSDVTLASPNYPGIYWNDLNCFWHVFAPDNGTILMTFLDFDTEQHYDNVTVWKGNNRTQNAEVLHLSGQLYPNSLSVVSSHMWVRFTSDHGYGTRGFLLQFDWSPLTVPCSADEFICLSGYGCVSEKYVCDSVPVCYDRSDEAGCQICGPDHFNLSVGDNINLTSPFYPKTYPEKWDCFWYITPIDDGYPVLRIIDMDTEKQEDTLLIGYGDNVTDMSSTLLELFDQIIEKTLRFKVTSLWMHFKTNHRVGKKGFLIQMELRQVHDCGTSSFQCQSGLVCVPSSFICDGYAQCADKKDEYQCEICGQEHIVLSANVSITVNLTSPLWPRPYPAEIQCRWSVTANDNGAVVLRFIKFNTTINQHYLQVGHGTSFSADTLVFRLSGQNMPKTVTVDTSEMWLTFSSDHEMSKDGFFIQLEWSRFGSLCESNDYVCSTSNGQICLYGSDRCDGVELCPGLEDERDCDYCGREMIYLMPDNRYFANLTSPFYPHQYPSVTCVWFITTPGNSTIVMRFVNLELETRYDYLYLGYGDADTKENQVVTLNGKMAPKTFQVGDDIMWVKFSSETGLKVTEGFYATLETEKRSPVCEAGDFPCDFLRGLVCLHSFQECDGVPLCSERKDEAGCGNCGQRYITLQVNEPKYNLQTINYPNNYLNDILCIWLVTSGQHRSILLKILVFELERGYDYVTVGNGHNAQDRNSRIAEFTGIIKLNTLVSRQSKLWIQLDTDRTGTRKGFDMLLTETTMNKGNETICEANDIDCGGGLCADSSAACDGFNDCLNLYDERECANITCPGSYLCNESPDQTQPQMCIPFDIVCDDRKDCPIGDDEKECDTKRCPDSCMCEYKESEFVVKCQDGWDDDLLQSLPRVSHTLELSGGNVITLESGTFKEVPGLRTLSLVNNNISVIQQRAFDGLRNLTWLDLSNNRITNIGSLVFEELVLLDGLFLWSVPIKNVRTGGFQGLEKLQTLVMVTEHENDEPVEVEKEGFKGLTTLQTLYVDDHRLCCHFSSQLECISLAPQSPLFMCGSLMQNTGLRICMWVLGISALLGNLFVIIWRFKQKTTKSSTQAVQSFLITNLAASDFLMGIYMLILASADAYFGEQYFKYSDKWRAGKMCKFAGFISLLSSEASVFFLTFISVDRFFSVVFPFSLKLRLTIMSAKVIGGIIWGIAFVISLVPVILAGPQSDFYDLSDVCIGLPLITRPSSYIIQESGKVGNPLSELQFDLPVAQESKPAWYFSIVIFLGINLVCFFVIFCCYIGVFVSLKVSAKKVRRRKRDEEIKIAVRMAIIVGTDFLCWMPVIIMGILSQTGAAVIPLQMYTWTVVLILPINSSINPYLYTIAALLSKRHFKVSPADINATSAVNRPNGENVTQNSNAT